MLRIIKNKSITQRIRTIVRLVWLGSPNISSASVKRISNHYEVCGPHFSANSS